MSETLRLRGISGDVKGRVWQSESLLRAGRLCELEIVLDDSSVSRRHAEVRSVENAWWIRDLNSTHGTYVNGVRLGSGERQLHRHDIIQFGKVAMMAEIVESPDTPTGPSSDHIRVEASTGSCWEEVFQRLTFDRNHCPWPGERPGDQLMALLRAGHHFVTTESEDELLHSILNDAVSVLGAQRGAIVLADAPDGGLRLRAQATGKGEAPGRFHFSKKLAQRCFSRGESILCCSVEDDAELKGAVNIADGARASVLCVLLRTPRRRLGVVYLERSNWQRAFTEDDLHLADAVAVHVSAGVEFAALRCRKRDLFLNSIAFAAQAVELRDEYTGGHSARVANYSLLLAQKLNLSAEDVDLIRIGAPLHDIGKIGIDDEILRKPGKLTEAEYEIMKTHTVKGAAIICTIPDLHPVIPIVRSHHERWDGRGYPDKTGGEATPLLARIVAVAEAFDAMTSNAPYHQDQKGKPPGFAFAEIRQMAGKQFDPECAQAFIDIRQGIIDTMRSNR